jgi:hypothetical protein
MEQLGICKISCGLSVLGANKYSNSTTDPVGEPPSTFEASGEIEKGNQQVVSASLPNTKATGEASNN